MTPWQAFVAKWKDCRRCALAQGRSTVVLARGKLPCHALFVGEAPGRSEDDLGEAFVGAAGHLLDAWIDRAGWNGGAAHPPVRCAFTNLCCCIPLDEDGEKVAEPPEDAVKACAPRLREFVALARPQLVICVGLLASKYVRRKLAGVNVGDVPLVDIVHPAAVLRANVAQQSLMERRAVVTLANAGEKLEL